MAIALPEQLNGQFDIAGVVFPVYRLLIIGSGLGRGVSVPAGHQNRLAC